MDGYELFQLGRTLMKLGEQSIPAMGIDRLSAPTRAIVSDIFENPDSSISDITARINFPQSQVSACVARLRDLNVVETVTDPQDRRRTLVRPTAETLRRAQNRPPAEIDAALARAVHTDDPDEIAQVKAALKALQRALAPRD